MRNRLPERLWSRDAGGSGSGGKRRVANLHLGGNRIGTRIPRMYKENITEPGPGVLDELIGAGRKSAKWVKASATLRCVWHHSPGARSGARFVGLTISPVL